MRATAMVAGIALGVIGAVPAGHASTPQPRVALPANGPIVWERNSYVDIVTPGGAPARLTASHAALESWPAWSPNGRKIAYIENEESVMVVNRDGSGRTQVATESSGSQDPEFSPDGTQVLYTREDASWHLRIAPADGSGSGQPVASGFSLDYQGEWSPNGTRIVFAGNQPGGTRDLWAVDPNGSNLVRLTNDSAWEDDPHWSPDGNTIVFTRQDGFDDQAIYKIDANGANEGPLVDLSGDDFNVRWSPSGDKIAFLSGNATQGIGTLNVANANGSQVTDVGGGSGTVFGFDWSPDGTMLVYSRTNGGSVYDFELYLAHADGSASPRLTNDHERDQRPDWGPACDVTGTGGKDVLVGTAGSDLICSGGGDDIVKGLGGDDMILGGSGNDKLIGGDGNDVVAGETGSDVISGGAGDDLLNSYDGKGGNDTLKPGDGVDTCRRDRTDAPNGCEQQERLG